jgi:hypothetical protein
LQTRGPEDFEGQATAVGNLYCNVLWIEDAWEWSRDGRYYCRIGNCEYTDDDLETIERHLFQFAQSQGYA